MYLGGYRTRRLARSAAVGRRGISLAALTIAAAAVGGAAVFDSSTASAQVRPASAPGTASNQEFEDLFQQVLRDPANLELTLRYATVATKIGDFEAAVTALERILFFNPNLPEVRLELGVLYYRLGSYAVARNYLTEARDTPTLSPEQKALAEQYLSSIAKLDSRHRLSGQVFAGFQHQTNANLGPSSAVRVFGFDATLDSRFTKQSDQSFFASGSAIYSYDLQDQDRDSIEVTAQAYASHYTRQHNFDLGYLETTAGPRSSLATWGLNGFSVRPYVLANYVQLGRDPFFHTYGAGLEASQELRPDLFLKGIYERREKNFENAPDRTTSRLLNGHDDTFTLSLAAAPFRNHVVTLSGNITGQSTRVDSYSNLGYGAAVSYQISYAPPVDLKLAPAPWQTAFILGRTWTNYDGPDPIVDPGATRFDRRWHFGIAQSVAITDDVSINVLLFRDIVSSTLPNYSFNNTSVLIGPQVRF